MPFLTNVKKHELSATHERMRQERLQTTLTLMDEGTVPIFVYGGIRLLTGDVESMWLFLQVEGKKNCRSVRVP